MLVSVYFLIKIWHLWIFEDFFFIWSTCEHVCVKIFTRIHWIEYKTICWLLFFFNQSVTCRSVALGRFEKFGWTTTKIQIRMCEKVEIYDALNWIALVLAFLCYSYQCWSLHSICQSWRISFSCDAGIKRKTSL